MASTTGGCGLDAYPDDLIARVVQQAASAADLAIDFLRGMGLAPSEGKTRIWSPKFLLGVGAACRLVAWEAQGLTFHIDAGLPHGIDAMRQVFLEAVDELGKPTAAIHSSLALRVLALTIEQLAWTGPRDLKAEILLDETDEDVLVEALAQHLFRTRRSTKADGRAMP